MEYLFKKKVIISNNSKENTIFIKKFKELKKAKKGEKICETYHQHD